MVVTICAMVERPMKRAARGSQHCGSRSCPVSGGRTGQTLLVGPWSKLKVCPRFTTRLVPGFWVELDIPKHVGGNEKRFGCPLLNFTLNRIMQTWRYIRLLALLKLGNVLPGEAVG